MQSWIDLHCHLNMLEIPIEEALQEAQSQSVDHMITIGTCAEDHPFVLETVEKYFPRVAGTLGVHPHEAKDWNKQTDDFLNEHLKNPKIIAVGEIGLDYYYDHSDRALQQDCFRRQLELAEQFELPVQVHTRDAEKDTIEILKEFEGRVGGVIHCFSGSDWLAKEALKIGFNISVSGIVTFKKADDLRQTVKEVPLDRLHVETDSPYLAPVPKRGKKNQPAYVTHTAHFLSDLLQVSPEELAEKTRQNAQRMFSRWAL